MNRYLALSLALVAVPLPVAAQTAPGPTESSAPAATTGTPAPVSSLVVIKRDTPIELIATKEVSTATVAAGSRFTLSVNKPLVLENRTVIPWGTRAIGEVTTASSSGGLGVTGKMTARLLYLQLGDAQIKLQGDVTEKGQGAGSAGVAILLSGWAGIFHRGNNAKIKAGEIVTAFVDEDVTLDVSGSAVKRVGAGDTPTPVDPAKASGTN